MKKKIYLPLYERWMKHGLDGAGLCQAFQNNNMDSHLLDYSFFTDQEANYHWCKYIDDTFEREFSPIRQNIVLLLAAMNNEL